MKYKHNIKKVSDDTGLTVNFIRRILNSSESIKNKHSIKSIANELLFDDNGLVLFREAARLKEQQVTLAKIVKQLDGAVSEPDQKPDQTLIELIKESHYETIRAKDQALLAQQKLIAELEGKILMISDGKSPEQFNQERESFNQERQQLKLELQAIALAKQEIEDQKQAEQAKRQTLLDELARLSWLQWGRKADLIKQLRELS